MIRPSFKTVHGVSPVRSGTGTLSARLGFTPPPGNSESNADRILLTLLALGLMLLAFFVVLTSTATLDQRRIREVVHSMQATFVKPHDDEGDSKNTAVNDAALGAAVSALRAVVADVFATLVPHDDSTPGKNTNPDRVEVDVPAGVFFADNEAVLYPLPVLDKLAAVLGTPPAGYRMELVVRTAAANTDALAQARLAALADGLVQRGLASTALSVGTLQGAQEKHAAASMLRFTFLLLDTDDDLAAVRLMTPKAAP